MQWGRWTFNAETACLETDVHPGLVYQVRVDEMNTSAEILDWLFQLEEKSWVTSENLGDVVRAVADIIGRGVAGGGRDNPVDARAILTARFGCQFE